MGTTLIVPCVHLNGSGKATLMNDLENAWDAVTLAYDALKRMEVNARDYYPYGPEAYPQAREEHLSRLGRLDSVRLELDALMGGVLGNKKSVVVEKERGS